MLTELHHVHLPHLDDAAIVAYDPDRREVTVGSALLIAISLIQAGEDALRLLEQP